MIEKCHVIVLVYDVNNHECKKRLKQYWMPRIVKINERAPVIFVGNKIDLRNRTADRNEHKNLLNDNFEPFQQVQHGIECSAKMHINLIDVIASAQRAYLYPVEPLYDSLAKSLKPDF